MRFSLDDEQTEKLALWQAEQDTKAALRQGRSLPNYGCSGGAYTYLFTPTTIGMVVRVRNGVTGDEIDLSDYDLW